MRKNAIQNEPTACHCAYLTTCVNYIDNHYGFHCKLVIKSLRQNRHYGTKIGQLWKISAIIGRFGIFYCRCVENVWVHIYIFLLVG